ncbi:MAG: sulfatase-like hydrolase/transferase [Rhizobiaceae bacterium]|nr:sulfatase-like hydrolase/transferase [Rhizobiaceae bacterium]
MTKNKNVLWIMADQLRWDYLSCYGHPHLHTPNIDRLAQQGVQFNRAYVNAPVCGASRMSYYTGRYCRSHGATWNFFPLRIGEYTLGDHLKELDVRSVLVGKTHMIADTEGMQWLGIDPNSDVGVNHAQCGFEVFERDDGLHLTRQHQPSNYDEYLRQLGFEGDNPWHDWANSAEGDDGDVLSGWLIKNNGAAARIPEEHSETAYMTNRAMEFMDGAGDQPWMCHLSYIKPHWPYIVPEPYHDMYPPETWLPVNRSEAEKVNAQPVFDAYMRSRVCRAFSQDKVRDAMLGAYMGLIKQIDDHLGRLFDHMEKTGLMDNTMIIMSSDHGDYLGDHWMGEKDLFHDCSVRVPLIIRDPDPSADASRGTVSQALVEGIDIAPTLLDYFGGQQKPQILEGKNLMPILRGETEKVRDWAISEYDYVTREARGILGVSAENARLVMCADQRWKFVHSEGFRPMLFDLDNDPNELNDLGASEDPAHLEIRKNMEARISEWARRHHNRTTKSFEVLDSLIGGEPTGIIIAMYDEDDYEQTFNHKFNERP